MQTFLPYESFYKSASCLDRLRLGKQRVECLQILNTLTGVSKGWANHPAVKMWRGYEPALVMYSLYVISAWTSRGYKDTCADKISLLVNDADIRVCPDSPLPPWLGDSAFHDSHKSNLVRKDSDYYRKYWPDIPDDLEYVWPVN